MGSVTRGRAAGWRRLGLRGRRWFSFRLSLRGGLFNMPIRANIAVRLLRGRCGIGGRGRATAVSLVEARAFEDNPGREEYAMYVARAIGAGCQRRVGNVLVNFETMTARFTEIFIRGHIRTHSLKHSMQKRTRSKCHLWERVWGRKQWCTIAPRPTLPSP